MSRSPDRPRGGRRVVRLIVFIVLAALAVAVLARAYSDTYRPQVHRVTIPAAVTRPFTIIQASDLHARRFGKRQAELARILRGAHADLAVITGDMIDRGHDLLQPALELAAVLRAHAPLTVFVAGNHDDQMVSDALSRHGVVILGHDTVVIPSGRPDVAIVATDDDGHIVARPDPGVALLVVAMHAPPDRQVLASARPLTRGTQLFLAGHTHGGQIRLPLIGAIAAPVNASFGALGSRLEFLPDLRGFLVKGERRYGSQWVSVSAGLGETFIPGRLFDPAELSLITVVPRP